ncbi:MAG: hypothetical protein NT146_13730 [Mycobacterium sp.]|nr:hypothetical protein [Mycobacterium sp.]
MTSREPTAPPEDMPYRDCRIAVGTRHGKEKQFAPPFEAVLGARLVTPPDLDTDRFGTFSGEIARTATASDTARAKARLAMEVSGLPYGLASEASYGPLPGVGIQGHEELVVFVDDSHGIEVFVGERTTVVPGHGQRVAGPADLPPHVAAGLPTQALIVRPSAAGQPGHVVKGITDLARLNTAITAAAHHSGDGLALVEPDLRAHHNPSRRLVLHRLADTLARRLATRCPACSTPGFGRVDSERGLPCRDCETPTDAIRNEIHACPTCSHRVAVAVTNTADSAWCPQCNP